LVLREQGCSYRSIAQQLKCSAGTAFSYVVQALKDCVPKETASQVLVLELARLDALSAKYYPAALKGDHDSARLCLKIGQERSRLCGLYPQDGGQHVHLNLGAEDKPTAEQDGIRVTFVRPPRVEDQEPRPADTKLIEHEPAQPQWRVVPQNTVESAPKPAPAAKIVPPKPRVDIWKPPIKSWMA
jgi:hypothetical protein